MADESIIFNYDVVRDSPTTYPHPDQAGSPPIAKAVEQRTLDTPIAASGLIRFQPIRLSYEPNIAHTASMASASNYAAAGSASGGEQAICPPTPAVHDTINAQLGSLPATGSPGLLASHPEAVPSHAGRESTRAASPQASAKSH